MTKQELFNQLKIDIAKGEGQHSVHVVDHAKERERVKKNEKSTKVYFNCYSPEAWKEFKSEKDRYFTISVDPRIAVELMTRALKAFSNQTLREWIEQGHEGEPAWLRK
jgi:hypothetical protein